MIRDHELGFALPKIHVMTFYDVFKNASNMSPSLGNNSSVSLKPKVSLKFNNDIDVDLHLIVNETSLRIPDYEERK